MKPASVELRGLAVEAMSELMMPLRPLQVQGLRMAAQDGRFGVLAMMLGPLSKPSRHATALTAPQQTAIALVTKLFLRLLA